VATMSTVTSLTTAIAIGAAAACFATATHAGDWSIGVGVTVPGVVVTAPPPVYVSPPPRYYAPPAAVPGYYYPPGYYPPPGYYGPAVACHDGYVDAYGRYYCRHRHEDDNDDND
jgi:hypothetical protein